jgi:hypothetical protein
MEGLNYVMLRPRRLDTPRHDIYTLSLVLEANSFEFLLQ